MRKLLLGLLLLAVAVLFCTAPTVSFASCPYCASSSTCGSGGLTNFCLVTNYGNGVFTCDEGGDCSAGGGGDGDGLPPRHHFAPGFSDEDRQAKVREITASPVNAQTGKLMIEWATAKEIATWCAGTPGCVWQYTEPDSPTAARVYTWGRLKMLYR